MPDTGMERERQVFAEELGRFFEERGLPRMEGRVLGRLIVCSPPHQSADELAEALGVSRGAISMAIRLLQRSEAVERFTVPGSRRHYYRLRPGFWRGEIDTRVQEAAAVRALAENGLKRLEGAPAEDLDRLRDLHAMYTFLERGYAALRDSWHGNGRAPEEHPAHPPDAP
ncbi:GbsR/MarR family transcriptional regulator [Streptomonospora nanhaiensis]|uniref:DNA-binding transcriptional regulator GbsR (MarR family) n=1 Tax=Streptomonospora nanhaiensis TaxID=1323731 RepID=A0A853BMA5_9ACTN|nr:MarR family transcriptional regulator [Streptomonospora nanhaiensis]MBV2363355.1 MarR family transcriptional regulator [Streptomonospora nanhaiensis]MBX9388505.1 HTH domain-containing protein [Streptomonospora nanhaiensis]NYI95716.1 DNA-binding transcriptional regulator GbsR (MarR family) [Streptomonospora nanhaiensis]